MKKLLLIAAFCLCLPTPALAQGDCDEVNFELHAASAANRVLRVTNHASCERLVGVAVYEPIDPRRGFTWDNQKLFSNDWRMVQPGETVTIHAYVPACGIYQFDPYHTLDPYAIPQTAPDFGQGEHLFQSDYYAISYDWCSAPEEPPTPPQEPEQPPTPPVDPLPPIDPVPPVQGPQACPVVGHENWWLYISDYSVDLTELGATASFTVTLPPGCTTDLHLISYVKRGCERFPQDYVDAAWNQFSSGRHSFPEVRRTDTLFQIDLRIGHHWYFGTSWEDMALTQEREDSYFARRTLEWRSDWTGCGA